MDAASLQSTKSKINKLTFSHLDVQHSGQDVSTFGTTISYVPKNRTFAMRFKREAHSRFRSEGEACGAQVSPK